MNALRKISTTHANASYAFFKGIVNDGDRLRVTAEASLQSAAAQYAGLTMLRCLPFDAVYISRLRPDAIEIADIAVIQQCAGIVDLSDQVRFDDGMD